MRLRDDDRAQSIQVGAVLLFGILIISFSTYQAVVVPDQNRGIEFDHNQQVQGEMEELRNAIVSMPGARSAQATSLTLGTTYPSRAVALNPSPASGIVRTVGTQDEQVGIAVRNATADGETGDFWDGSRHHYDSGGIVYEPSYNLYTDAPDTVYEHSVLYNEFDSSTMVRTDQSLVDGRSISLTTLNGSFDRGSSGSTTVDVRPVSSSTETVQVTAPDADSPLTLEFASRLDVETWESVLEDEDNVVAVEAGQTAVPASFNAIRVEFDPDVTYRLQMTKVGVGSHVSAEDPAYLTDVDGDDETITRGDDHRVTLAVKDRFNNPVSGVTVNASVGADSGSFESTEQSTDGDGRVTFEYQTTPSTSTGTHQLNFTVNDSATLETRPFEDDRPKNASMDVTVTESSGGGGSPGAYSVDWADPSAADENSGAALSSCSTDACTWDVGASDDDTLTLNSTLSPPYEGVNLEFAVSNSTVGTVSPGSVTTGSDGAGTTELTAHENGTVDVLASGNEGSDVIEIEVENVAGDGTGDDSDAGQMELVEDSGSTFWGGEGVEFDVENTGTDSVSVTAVTLEGTSAGNVENVWEDSGGSYEQGQHEVYIDSSTEGVLEMDGEPYWEDDGTPLEFDETEQMTEDATFTAGETATVSIYAFRNNGGQVVDMTGETVTLRLHYSDGSDTAYTVEAS